MDILFLREAMTVVSFLAFMGVVAYALYPANRGRFEAAAQAPFDDGETLTPALSLKAEGEEHE